MPDIPMKRLIIDENAYEVIDAEARSSILNMLDDLFYKPNDVESGWFFAVGILTSGGTTLRVFIPVQKSLKRVSGFGCEFDTIQFRSIPKALSNGTVQGGYIINAGTSSNQRNIPNGSSFGETTYPVSGQDAEPVYRKQGLFVYITFPSAITDFANNVPVVGALRGTITFN